jgi:hypothetical protein
MLLPVIEADAVYVHYGSHGTACLTRDGEVQTRGIVVEEGEAAIDA